MKQVAVAVDNVLHDESAAAAQAAAEPGTRSAAPAARGVRIDCVHRNLNELFTDLAQRLPRVVPFDYINLLLHDPARDVMRLHIL